MKTVLKPFLVCLLLASITTSACWAEDDSDSDDDSSSSTSSQSSDSSGSSAPSQGAELSSRQAQSCNTNLCLGETGAQLAECANPLKTLYDMKPHKRPSYLAACPK